MLRKTILFIIAIGPAFAASPNQVSYQGFLQNTDGSPVTGTVSLQIGVWNDAVSSASSGLFYLEDHFGVTVENGLFSVPLGGGTVVLGTFDAELFADDDRWLEIRVEGEPLTPRTKFLTVPYALQAKQADTLSGLSGAVMHFASPACPPGWSELTDARGRVIVGLPSGGTLAGTTGAPLTDLETRHHTHSVTTPATVTGSAGSHSHSVSTRTTSSDTHNHRWTRWNGSLRDWTSFRSSGTEFTITNWSDGMDQAGSGIYPIAATSSGTTDIYTDLDSHNHSVSSFSTSFTGTHSHSVGGVTAVSAGASQNPALPYLQLLACIKD